GRSGWARLSDYLFFFFQAEDGIRDFHVTGVQTCALPIFVGVAPAGDVLHARRDSGFLEQGRALFGASLAPGIAAHEEHAFAAALRILARALERPLRRAALGEDHRGEAGAVLRNEERSHARALRKPRVERSARSEARSELAFERGHGGEHFGAERVVVRIVVAPRLPFRDRSTPGTENDAPTAHPLRPAATRPLRIASGTVRRDDEGQRFRAFGERDDGVQKALHRERPNLEARRGARARRSRFGRGIRGRRTPAARPRGRGVPLWLGGRRRACRRTGHNGNRERRNEPPHRSEPSMPRTARATLVLLRFPRTPWARFGDGSRSEFRGSCSPRRRVTAENGPTLRRSAPLGRRAPHCYRGRPTRYCMAS